LLIRLSDIVDFLSKLRPFQHSIRLDDYSGASVDVIVHIMPTEKFWLA